MSPWRVRNRAERTLFGLCTFENDLKLDEGIDGASLLVGLGPATKALSAEEFAAKIADGVWRCSFQLQTHVIDNGSHKLSITLRWPDGHTIAWESQTVEIANTGALAEEVRSDLLARGAPAIFAGPVDSSMFPYGSGRAAAWFEKRNGLPDLPMSMRPAPDRKTALDHLMRWGFCVLDTTLPRDLIDNFNKEVDEAVRQGVLAHKPGSSERVLNSHRLPHGRKIWLFPAVLSFLRDWFRDEPCACQTLLFINGSEQNPHQDTIHLTPYPQGYMCGVWIALEDVKPNSGELFVYPGSHLAPRIYGRDLGLAKVSDDYSSYAAFDRRVAELIDEGGFGRHFYRPKAGQILVWHENLAHGGCPRIDRSLSRRSIVSHYFPRGCVAYYDSRGEAAALERIA